MGLDLVYGADAGAAQGDSGGAAAGQGRRSGRHKGIDGLAAHGIEGQRTRCINAGIFDVGLDLGGIRRVGFV